MQVPKSILVVISARRQAHAALERALKFAEVSGIHIHLFNSIYEPVLELTDVLSSDHRKELKEQYIADRTLYMEKLADQLRHKGIATSVHVSWHRELNEAIEEISKILKPDLIVKRVSEDVTLNPFAMPIDRYLLRHSPSPILLVRHHGWTQGPIIAAIDPLTNDPDHMALNHQVMSYAMLLARFTSAPLHVVNTFVCPAISAGSGLPGFDFSRIAKDTANFHRSKMNDFISDYAIDPERVHILEGDADVCIPDLARKLEAQVVVMGTVGRSGISAAFIGNTAEHVLAKLPCEVLTTQPEHKHLTHEE